MRGPGCVPAVSGCTRSRFQTLVQASMLHISASSTDWCGRNPTNWKACPAWLARVLHHPNGDYVLGCRIYGASQPGSVPAVSGCTRSRSKNRDGKKRWSPLPMWNFTNGPETLASTHERSARPSRAAAPQMLKKAFPRVAGPGQRGTGRSARPSRAAAPQVRKKTFPRVAR